jgi:eukaryotic-like serine/threonine-protein kinase
MTDARLPVKMGEMIAGKYIVERLLGEGGMGVVVAAKHVSLDQRVAIKFLLPEARALPGLESRFANEARAAAKLKSEHVARVIDVDTLMDGTPFMVMEYLEGQDLAALLVERQQVPVEEAAGYVLEACEALAEAHAKGIVHRDIKPGNLFVARGPDGSHSVKILDFGVSKSQVEGSFSLTHTSAVLGSPLYMPPEQMTSSRDVDGRADLWALGVVLYELVTGTLPFDGETLPGLVANIIKLQPKPMSERGANVPPGFEELVLRCLEKDPADRLSSVGELAVGLAPFAGRNSDTSLDRISRLEATNKSIPSPSRRDSLARSQPKRDESVIVAQSETPLPLKTVVSDRKRNPAVLRAEHTLAGWDSPEERRPHTALLVGGASALTLVGALVAASLWKHDPGPRGATSNAVSAPVQPSSPTIATPDSSSQPAAPPPTFTAADPSRAVPPASAAPHATHVTRPTATAPIATPPPTATSVAAPPTPPPTPAQPPASPPKNTLEMEPK